MGDQTTDKIKEAEKAVVAEVQEILKLLNIAAKIAQDKSQD